MHSNASWNPNAVTFGNQTISFSEVFAIFVNTNNTIYVSDLQNKTVKVWENGNLTPIRTISEGVQNPYSIYVTTSDEIYVSNGPKNRVDKWLPNVNSSLSAMQVYSNCFGMFIDISNTLYCGVGEYHFIVSMPLNDPTGTLTLVAGQSCSGSDPDMLNGPGAILVDFSFSLLVADWGNNRIQNFPKGEKNATTVAGWGAPTTITLNHPTGVMLDADGYLFIADTDSNRIVGSGPNGFRCIAGCSTTPGSASDQLHGPQNIAFDSFGNIWVTDHLNNRVQKFTLDCDSCGMYHHIPFYNYREGIDRIVARAGIGFLCATNAIDVPE